MLIVAAIFLAGMGYFVHTAFSTGGSVFGASIGPGNRASIATAAPPAVNVQGGGPPPAVRTQLADLRARIAHNPKDDVAMTQLGDMYLAVGKYADAIPLYKQALKVNPSNVAAKEGLSEAESESKNQ